MIESPDSLRAAATPQFVVGKEKKRGFFPIGLIILIYYYYYYFTF